MVVSGFPRAIAIVVALDAHALQEAPGVAGGGGRLMTIDGELSMGRAAGKEMAKGEQSSTVGDEVTAIVKCGTASRGPPTPGGSASAPTLNSNAVPGGSDTSAVQTCPSCQDMPGAFFT